MPRPVLGKDDPGRQKKHKTLRGLMRGQLRRPPGSRRNAFSTARLSLPDVGAARNQRPGCVSPTIKSVGYFASVRLRDGKFIFNSRRAGSMETRSGLFSNDFRVRAFSPDAGSRSSAATPDAIDPNSTCLGDSPRHQPSPWVSCRRIVQNSHQASLSTHPPAFAIRNRYFGILEGVIAAVRLNSLNGFRQIRLFDEYARLLQVTLSFPSWPVPEPRSAICP